MGTRAHWFSSPWRYRREDDLGWTYASSLADIKADAVGESDAIQVQKRTGRKAEGYTYADHSTIAASTRD